MSRRRPPNALLRVDNGGDAAAARAQRGARPKRDAPGPEGPVPEVAPTELNPVRPLREKQIPIWRQRDLADSSDEEEVLGSDGEPVLEVPPAPGWPQDDGDGSGAELGESDDEEEDDEEQDEDDLVDDEDDVGGDEGRAAAEDDDDDEEDGDVAVGPAGGGKGTKRKKAQTRKGAGKTPKTNKQDAEYLDPWGDVGARRRAAKVFVVAFDIETTGSKKYEDRIIELGMVVYDECGQQVGAYEQRYTTQGVPVSNVCYAVHHISESDVKHEPRFEDEAARLCAWLEGLLPKTCVAVLLAHNGVSCDFPFLFAELHRAGAALPSRISYVCDSLQLLRKKRGLPHGLHELSAAEYPERTGGGKPSFKLEALVDHLLDDEDTFRSVCGDAHEATADAKGAYVVLSKALLPHKARGLAKPIDVWVAKGAALLEVPVVPAVAVPTGWGETTVDAPTAVDEAATVPDAADAVAAAAPRFSPPRGRTPGASRSLMDAVRHTLGSVQGLLLALFFVFWPTTLLRYVVDATNAYATRTLVVVRSFRRSDGQSRDVMREPAPGDPPDAPTRPRRRNWTPLTVAELCVFLGIMIKAGVSPRRTYTHYWSSTNGLRDGDIASAMTSRRFFDIYAMLTFRPPGEEGRGLAKIAYVADQVQANFKGAFNPTQFLSVDESMGKCASKFCPFLQRMPSKPIKLGFKIWVVADATHNYLYGFEIFTGGDGLPGAMYRLVHDRLIDPSFDETGTIVFMDNLFTSIALFVALAKRGIFAVGPMRSGRPKGGGDADHWPFQTYGANLLRLVPRGWRRTAQRDLDGGAALSATVWRDNKFVTLLHSTFPAVASVLVLRWVREKSRKLPVAGFLALVAYAKYMGGVDRIDKTIKYANIRLAHCAKRYHRSIFFWLICATWNNILVLFFLLYPGADTLDHGGLGVKTWLQIELATALMRHGCQEGYAALSQAERSSGATPSWMPRAPGRHAPPLPAASTIPKRCELVSADTVSLGFDSSRHSTGTMGKSACKACYRASDVSGERQSGTNGTSNRVMPAGHHREGKKPAQTRMACKGCKVHLCSAECFAAWDHAHGGRLLDEDEEVVTVCATRVVAADPKRRKTA